jgi:hypothetical protein
VGKSLCLTGTRARNDQKRRRRRATADAEFDRYPLAFVQVHKVTTLRWIHVGIGEISIRVLLVKTFCLRLTIGSHERRKV